MRFMFGLLVFPVLAFELSSGLYKPVKSNNDSVCPQKIQVTKYNDEIFLKAIYVGDCFYQGPFTFYCEQNICTDGVLEYQITSSKSFNWLNKNYQIWGNFIKED